MIFEIKHRFTGEVLFSLETDSLKLCVEAAVKSKANLRDADLGGADLMGANLGDADLMGANLRDADLMGADLRDAYLMGANLRGAYLGDAYLRGANLGDAYLGGADLGGANLGGANLMGADLRGADLGGANLMGADLRGADLGDADLRGANLKAKPDEIARLDAVREVILSQPNRLHMGLWHGDKWTADHTPEEEHSCGTPHCLAGWLQALCPDKEIRKMDPEEAGRKLAPVASGLFYSSNSIVMDFLKERWYAGKS